MRIPPRLRALAATIDARTPFADAVRQLQAACAARRVEVPEALCVAAVAQAWGGLAAGPPLEPPLDAGVPPLWVRWGRFGPYVTDGVRTASLQGHDPRTLTRADAEALLA